MRRPYIISIEGNIGSGKSRLYNNLKHLYTDRKEVYFVPEPVKEWSNIVDSYGTPILNNFYYNTKRYAFRFQMMAYISRLSILRQAMKRECSVIITERCLQSDKNVFAKMLYDEGNIEHDEYQIYTMWFNEFSKELNPDHIIYMKTSPQVCQDRIKSRGRDGEETIPLNYLRICHNYHNNWLDPIQQEKDITILNGDTNVNTHKETQQHWVNTLKEKIKIRLKDIS